MKRIFSVFAFVFLSFLFISCPTPFGVMYADRIYHWNGNDESIEEWLDGSNPFIDDTEDDDVSVVTIILDWGEETE